MNKKIKDILINQKLLVLIFIIGIIFYFLIPGFLGYKNIIQILLRISIQGVIVIGMTYLIICREIDLSVGRIMSMSAAFSVLLLDKNIVLAVVVSLVVGTIIGLLNGIISVKLKIPSIASTLGMSVVLTGLVYLITGSDSIYGRNKNFQLIADSKLLGIPTVLIILLVLIFLFDMLLRKTVWGKNIYATGNNITAARYANIRVDRLRIGVFVLTGTLCGIAGILLVSRFNVASGAIGFETPMFVIIAVLLGGVSLSGGEGNVFKAFQGLLLVGILENIFVHLKFHTSYRLIVMGILLIVLLSIDGVYMIRSKYK